MAEAGLKNKFAGSTAVLDTRKEADPEKKADTSGVGFGIKDEEQIPFEKMDCEIVLPESPNGSPDGAYIVFGRDRVRGGSHPDAASTGKLQYGDIADCSGTAMIDLVVGRCSALNDPAQPLAASIEVTDDDGNKKLVPVPQGPDFIHDAARIYISQMSAIDEALELDEGSVGNPQGKSAIALKADGIRIVAREGIKIIADCDVKNSAAFPNTAKGGINLIYGNTTAGPAYELQPLVKGKHLWEALADMNDVIGKIMSLLTDIEVLLIEMGGAHMMHMHIGNLGAPTPLSPPDIPQNMMNVLTLVNDFGTKCMGLQATHAIWKSNYLFPVAKKYILSNWNYCN